MPKMTEAYSYLIAKGRNGSLSILEHHAADHDVVFKYLATDYDGRIYAFETEPFMVPEYKRWAEVGHGLQLEVGQIWYPGLDWTTTKVRLPTKDDPEPEERTFLVTIKEVPPCTS